MSEEKILNKVNEYLKIPSVVGHEAVFLKYLAKDFSKLGCNVQLEREYLKVWKNIDNPTVLSAHVDRHGIITTGERDQKYMAYSLKPLEGGRYNQSQLASLAEGFDQEEVFAYCPASGQVLGRGVINGAYFSKDHNNIMFPVDGLSKLEADAPVAFARKCSGNGTYVEGQIDNVVSVALIYMAFEAGFMGSALLTTKEEIGESWMQIMQNYREGQRLIVLDTSPFDSSESADYARVVLRQRDEYGVFDAELFESIRKYCEAHKIPYEVKDEFQKKIGGPLGRTELGKVIEMSGGQLNGATLQVPTFGYHSNSESTTLKAAENVFRVLMAVT